MIPVEELIYEFKLNLNKMDRQDNVQVPLEDILVFLNQAQISWIKSKVGENNIFRDGYEGTRKRIDDLQVLKVNDASLTLQKTTDVLYKGYKADLKTIPDYMMYVMSHVGARKEDCKAGLTVDLIRQNDLSSLYFDANFSPSYEWRTTLATIGQDNIIVYTDDTFEIENLYLTYLRYPMPIDSEGYIKIDGLDSSKQDCELPYYAKPDILNLATKFAAQSVDNQAQSTFAEDRSVKNTE
jgi:hypothetical protein